MRRSSGSGSSSLPPAAGSPRASPRRCSLSSSRSRSRGLCSGRPCRRSTPKVTASRGFASRWATGTRSLSSRTWRSRSGSGSGRRRGHRRSVRVAGGLLVYVATLSLLLTLSRAGVLVAVGVLVLWLALSSERVESGLLLLASAGPAVLVGAWAFTRPALTEDVATRSDRVADGAVFGVPRTGGSRGRRRSRRTRDTTSARGGDARKRVGRGLVVVVAVCAVGGSPVSASRLPTLCRRADPARRS